MINDSAILGATILIVDDQASNVLVLELMLRHEGYSNIHSTTDSTAVCALHAANHYDLILLDLNMPQTDGFEIMEDLNLIETDSYLSVIVIAGQPKQKLRALRAGAKDFISKPFDQSEVLTRIYNLLEVRLLHADAKTQNKFLQKIVLDRTADLGRSEAMFRDLAANIPEAVWIRDTDRQAIQYANPAFEKLSGLNYVYGNSIEDVYRTVHPDDQQWVTHERRKVIGGRASSEFRLVRPDASIRWVHARTFEIENPSGGAPWLAEILEDITERKEAERLLLHSAQHDALTDIPNRALLYDSLRAAIRRAEADGMVVSVMVLDIDYFKTVNDTLGHVMGDALLREFAARLTNCVRPGDIVGRLGGDEFMAIILTPEGSQNANEIARRILNAMQSPFELMGHNILVTTSIGIANSPADSSEFEALVKFADAAMYQAKASGRNTFRSYSAEMHLRATNRSEIECALRSALKRDEFELHYQPKMRIDTGICTGVEALIRWNRADSGQVSPSEFVPVLEETGLIVPVGLWIVDTACRQIREWELAGLGRIRIAVNVSARQVREEKFAAQVASILRAHDVDPELLEFEITESTFMTHEESTDHTLKQLRDMGISISIDDFGTGYSNFAYLRRFRVDAVKIDIAFIRDVTTNQDSAKITIAIINMAKSLQLIVIAEGVETPEQLDFLTVHGCDEIQGYLLSEPLPASRFSASFIESVSRIAGHKVQWSQKRRRVANARA